MLQFIDLLSQSLGLQLMMILVVVLFTALAASMFHFGERYGLQKAHRAYRLAIKEIDQSDRKKSIDLLEHAVNNSLETLNLYRTNGAKILDQLMVIASHDANIGHKFDELMRSLTKIFDEIDGKATKILETRKSSEPDLDFWHHFESRVLSNIHMSKESIAIRAAEIAIEKSKPRKKSGKKR